MSGKHLRRITPERRRYLRKLAEAKRRAAGESMRESDPIELQLENALIDVFLYAMILDDPAILGDPAACRARANRRR